VAEDWPPLFSLDVAKNLAFELSKRFPDQRYFVPGHETKRNTKTAPQAGSG